MKPRGPANAEPTPRDWLYLVPTPAAAAAAVRALDALPRDVLVGLGVFAIGNPARWYVYTNTEEPEDEEAAFIGRTLAAFGEPAPLTLDNLFRARPHFVATGPGEVILTALAATTGERP